MCRLIFAAVLAAWIGTADAAIDLKAVAAQAASNVVARIAGAISAKTNAVRALATPKNYALLKSTKLKDAAAKLALQKQLAEAALVDEEQTEAGRIKWHGRYVGQRIDMATLTATFIHEDGTEYAVKFQRPSILAAVDKANAKMPKPPMTNGVPESLAKARIRRYEERIGEPLKVTAEKIATGGQKPQ